MTQDWVSAAEIEAVLREALQPVQLVVTDDSAAHMGHAGSNGQGHGTHFSVQVSSVRFNGLRPVQRHRLVYDALRDLMPRGIHALAIQAEPV